MLTTTTLGYQNKMKKKVLITGAKGFIGSHLVEALRDTYEVSTVDLKDGQDIFNLTEKEVVLFDTVIHLAALIDVRKSFDNPMEYYWTNMMGTAHIAFLCKRTGARLIYTSSAAIVDPKSSPYADSKYYAHHILEKLQPMTDIVILTLFNIYGKGMNKDSVLYRFIHDKELTVYGSGMHTRDFINIVDVVNIIKFVLDNDVRSVTLQVGTGRAKTISSLANYVSKLMGKKINYVGKIKEVENSQANVKALKKIYPYKLKTNLKKDIEEMIGGLN